MCYIHFEVSQVIEVSVSPYVLCVFFKQKTAYEMSISDWSSDVCSSDLPTFLRSRLMAVRQACRDTAPAENPCAACQSDLSVDRRFFVDTGLAELTGLFVILDGFKHEDGRAHV